MKKNCIIIHGCPSNREKAMDPATRTYDKHWIPWAKNELIKSGISTLTPYMPDPWEPVYEKFKKEFEKYEVNEGTILIGHSCGCTFLVRWLGETKRKIHKLILVVPWKIAEGSPKSEMDFYKFPIDGTIGRRVDQITIFTSDNDEEGGKRGAVMFHEALGGDIISLPGHGHYVLDDMGTEEFPELIDIIIKDKI
ncbi:MAG: alpha/beta hydrolase [Patescibacteria group bacterium]|jgi:predicted alpha/beta hydrolase family esterase